MSGPKKLTPSLPDMLERMERYSGEPVEFAVNDQQRQRIARNNENGQAAPCNSSGRSVAARAQPPSNGVFVRSRPPPLPNIAARQHFRHLPGSSTAASEPTRSLPTS